MPLSPSGSQRPRLQRIPALWLVLGLCLLWGSTAYAESALDSVEFTTAQAQPDAPLPMIIAIHGLGDTPENFSRFLREFPAPARVVALRAPDRYGSGFSWFPIRARSGAGDPQLATVVGAAAQKIAGHVETLVKTRPTVGKPVVLGFSQGGILCFALASRFPDIFAASLPIAGMLPTRLARGQTGRIAVHGFHGDRDTLIPAQAGLDAVQALKTRGYRAELKRYPGLGHRFSPTLVRDLFDTLGRILPNPK